MKNIKDTKMIVAFWGGMKYASAKNASGMQNPTGQFGQAGGPNGLRAGRGGRGGGFTTGEIIAADATTITVKLQSGGSKIIFLSDATPITKSVDGAKTDLAVGKTVMVTGPTNSDGSVTAQSVMLRPAMTPPPAPAATPAQ
jgi:hypothetical protein